MVTRRGLLLELELCNKFQPENKRPNKIALLDQPPAYLTKTDRRAVLFLTTLCFMYKSNNIFLATILSQLCAL